MAEYNESQINSNETERISAEQQRIQNEAKRQTKETEREAREAIRQSNESTRISEYNTFMADVHNAEDERIANEQRRVQAEASRVTAENSRGVRLTELENEVNDVVDTIMPMVSDLSSSVSEELTNNSITSFKAGTSNVTGIDLSERMEQSIVTLDNIEGKTEFLENMTDTTQKLKNTRIKLLYTLDEDDQVNYFNTDNLEMGVLDSKVNYQHSTSPSETIRIHSDVALRGSCLLVEVTGLTPGEVYCLTVGNIVVDNGVSAIAIYDSMKHNLLSDTMAYHSEDPTQSDTGLVAKVSSDRLGFIFYSNTGLDVAGDVTYQDISLRKVKEYSPMNITLRSLPNGIKDEIKDGKLIKRVESYTLNGSEDWVLADNSKTNTVSFACSLSNAVPVNKEVISLNSNKYKSSSDAELYVEDTLGLAIGGLNGTQLLFRVDRGLNSVEKLKYHLANEEKDIIIEYAIEPEVYDIDLSITCAPGETVFIDTNRSISCSHRVQLSTKSQVEETQKQIIKSNKSIWQKFKELTDVKMQINENGYIKFPTVLGGLLIQWGSVKNTPGIPEIRINLPVAYSEKIYGMQFTGQWGHANHHYWVSGNTDYKTFITPIKIGSQDVVNVSDPVYWFTIGI